MILFPLLVCCGCSDSPRPTDLPPLFPCTISVTQGGAPLADAYVELVSPDVPKYRPSATTDASGNAAILTYGYPGAPAGKYKILVRKNVEDDIVYGKDAYGEQFVVSSNIYKLVEDNYADVEKTPHEIEITSKKSRVTVDVGTAIRNKIVETR